MSVLNCSVCEGDSLETFHEFSSLKRVTSDAKPFPEGGKLMRCAACGALQKPNDALWTRETAAIYQQYAIYNQGGRGEPKVFEQGPGASRSDYVLNHLCQEVSLPESLSVLDIGTGTGVFLEACAQRFPEGQFYGYDLDDKFQAQLNEIPNFKKLFTGDLSTIEGTFDLITLSHCLEHVPVPGAMLKQIRSLLKPSGLLLIQVPDAARNPFDLLVADHRTHFEQATLRHLLVSRGFSCVNNICNWKATELSMIATPVPQEEAVLGLSNKRFEDWAKVVTELKAWEALALSVEGPVAVWGTGMGAAWLFGYIKGQISFFVDEDTARVGSLFLGKPVKHPSELSPAIPILAPLPPQVLKAVQERWRALNINMPVTYPCTTGG
tara:strand:+ start:72042 stop:73181 length:1140 start_codon:yes stop_codon:yes gene_type:complete